MKFQSKGECVAQVFALSRDHAGMSGCGHADSTVLVCMQATLVEVLLLIFQEMPPP